MSANAVASVRELQTLLQDNGSAGAPRRVRLHGLGSRPRLVGPAPTDVLAVSLRALDRIERLEADDLTCSVQPGVRCGELAAALAAAGLELGGVAAGDDGTVGGLYASDPLGPPVPGLPCPRSTLLGIEGVLADGTDFRAGARVVKSVAGFDVHRLFVGSRGRLFAATQLHLKLRPAPRARAAFALPATDRARAVELFLQLRRAPSPPQRLVLRSEGDLARVEGRFAGRATQVQALLRQFGLQEVAGTAPDHLGPPAADREIVVGRTRAARVAALLANLPAGAPLLVHGGGHFEVELLPAQTDALLPHLHGLEATAVVAEGRSDRIGRSTPHDAAAARLQRDLHLALDPRGVLA